MTTPPKEPNGFDMIRSIQVVEPPVLQGGLGAGCPGETRDIEFRMLEGTPDQGVQKLLIQQTDQEEVLSHGIANDSRSSRRKSGSSFEIHGQSKYWGSPGSTSFGNRVLSRRPMRLSALRMVIACLLSLASAAFAQDGEGSVHLDAAPLPATPLTLKSLDVTDLRDVRTNLLTLSGRQLTVMVFLYPECPLSRQAIPVLNQIAEELSKKGGVVLGLFRDVVTRPELEGFASEFKTRFPLLRDPGGNVAKVLHATTTPEAFVVDATGRIRYAGRVDDQYRVRGVRRPAPEREDLQEAVRDVLAGVDVRVPRTRPVGCPLNRKDDPVDPEPGSTEVTYHREVIRILNTHCLKCHSEGGRRPVHPHEL